GAPARERDQRGAGGQRQPCRTQPRPHRPELGVTGVGALGEDHQQLSALQGGSGGGEGVRAARGASMDGDLPGGPQDRAGQRDSEQGVLGQEPRGDAAGLQQMPVGQGVERAAVVAAGDRRAAFGKVVGADPLPARQQPDQWTQHPLRDEDHASGTPFGRAGGAEVPAARERERRARPAHQDAADGRPSALRAACPVTVGTGAPAAMERRRRVVGARRARVLTAEACISRRGAKAIRPRTERYFTAVVTWSSSPPGSSATPMRTLSFSSSSRISASPPTTSSTTYCLAGGGTMSNRRIAPSRTASMPRLRSGVFSWEKIASAHTRGSVSATPRVGTMTTSQ